MDQRHRHGTGLPDQAGDGGNAVLVIVLVAALVTLIQKTKIGMAMRAASRDFETAQLMGIKINHVISFTFAVGSFLAAIGSMMYFSNYTAVTPTVGAMPGLKAFVAAVFGGIGSIPGAVIGGFIIGICESLIKGAGATTFSDAFTFALLIVVLAVKPTGLFSEKPDRESGRFMKQEKKRIYLRQRGAGRSAGGAAGTG